MPGPDFFMAWLKSFGKKEGGESAYKVICEMMNLKSEYDEMKTRGALWPELFRWFSVTTSL